MYKKLTMDYQNNKITVIQTGDQKPVLRSEIDGHLISEHEVNSSLEEVQELAERLGYRLNSLEVRS